MSEATMTATAPAEAPLAQVGAIVRFDPTDDGARLAIVAHVVDDSDIVEVISRCCPDDEELATYATSRATLTAAPPELVVGQWALVQRLTARLVTEAQDRGKRLEPSLDHLRERAEAAERKIESMRAYAIGKHLDGTICRDGLNDFLAAHDLATYQPRYSAQVTFTLDVEVYDADNANEAAGKVRECLEVSSNDEDEVSITWASNPDISGVELMED